jgi:uncharacterized protein (TIGR00251 family)
VTGPRPDQEPAHRADQLIAVRVIPRARREGVDGERAGRLLVRTAAAPVDGKANAAVCRIVADHLGVPARLVEIDSGERSRDKVLRIRHR